MDKDEAWKGKLCFSIFLLNDFINSTHSKSRAYLFSLYCIGVVYNLMHSLSTHRGEKNGHNFLFIISLINLHFIFFCIKIVYNRFYCITVIKKFRKYWLYLFAE